MAVAALSAKREAALFARRPVAAALSVRSRWASSRRMAWPGTSREEVARTASAPRAMEVAVAGATSNRRVGFSHRRGMLNSGAMRSVVRLARTAPGTPMLGGRGRQQGREVLVSTRANPGLQVWLGPWQMLSTMGHAIAGAGFFAIEVDPIKGKSTGESFTAVIKFKGTPLSPLQISDEFKDLVDVQWDWQVEVEIWEAFLSPKPALCLSSVWVQLSGFPDGLMEMDRLMAAMVLIGCPLEVDELSLRKCRTEPIRMRFQCRYPERIKGTVQLVVNGEGYDISVKAELGGRGGGTSGPGPAPSPPRDDDQDDEDYDDLSPSEEEWNDLGKKDKDKRNQAAAVKSPEAPKGKEQAAEARGGGTGTGGYHSAPQLGVTESRLRSIYEYGSNLAVGGMLASFRQPRSLMVPVASPPKAVEGSTESQVCDPTLEGGVDTGTDQGMVVPMAEAHGELPGAGGFAAATPERPPGGAGGQLSSPLPEVVLPVDGEVVPVVPAAREKSMTAATYSRAHKKKDKVLSVRKSSRHNKASINLSALEKAKRLTADKNLDSVFNPSRGSPCEILYLVRARELAQASIAVVALKKEREEQLAAAREADVQVVEPEEGPTATADPEGVVASVPQGLGGNLGKEKRDRKAGLMAQVEALDALADSSGLDEEGWAFRYHLEDQVVMLDSLEEEYWRQRSSIQWLLKGDACTAYFHAIANGRRRKCGIPRLISEQGELSDQNAIMGHVYDFYRQLMGTAGEARAFTLAHDLWPASKRISDAENWELERSFTIEELDAVLHDMEVDSAPGPDGLPVAFFLSSWSERVLRHYGSPLDAAGLGWPNGGERQWEIGPFFRNARGVRQGDPLSPILFDFMVDALAAMLSRAKEAGHILGLVRHLIPGGVTHLQYADDTMVMIEPSDEGIANLKLVLISFELMSGLKINLAKSEVVVVGTTPLEQERVARLLNFRLGKFPIKYLGLPLSNKTLRASDWDFLTSKVAKRVDPWQAFDKVRSRFFWEGVGDKRKYHMVDWPTVCRPKEVGGLGILNTRHMNIALMLKWVWKLYHNADGLWADLIKAKYLGEHDLFSPLVPTKGSQFWNSIQRVKWYFKLGAKHCVRNGKRTFFWLDWWLGTAPLRDRYPVLFSCCDSPFITVLGARDGPGWRLRFGRPFSLAETVEWDNLTRELDFTQASADDDVVSWRLEASGDFSAKSLYCRLSQGAAVMHFREQWRMLVKWKDRGLVDAAMDSFRRMHADLAVLAGS
ncbi:hypothetical protein QYE76_031334 [Lolium multiflorum]|uniref:Reverse transcriptase domain-containing protein n=1 Tax=Lolium multiflorum TaxID=4521 RepID=A0AAD8QT03_LOLMU|nr:hypothetical protein QYE76_031334 [Lolium multiflorum]